jgi:predicted peptidase
MVIPMTSGIISIYQGSNEVKKSSAVRYTENRTTAFKAAGTDIFGVGTNKYHVSLLNKTLGCEYQNG